jgi:hypothetical protein
MVTLSFDLLSVGKFVAALIAAVFVFLLLRTIWRFLRRLFLTPRLEGMDRRAIQSRWAEIERLTASGSEMNLKMAVMEADKLLDHALKALAIPGATLGERLKYAAYTYPKIRNVWNAHRLRNQLVHESSFYLEPSYAKRAIRDYKDALGTLHLL